MLSFASNYLLIIFYSKIHFLINVLIKSDEKTAALIAISIINLRQALREGTINVNMASQTILSKFPRLNSTLLPFVNNLSEANVSSFDLNRNDHKLYFKPLFDLVNKNLLFIKIIEIN